MNTYNLLSCKGFELVDKVTVSFGGCAKARLVLVLIFFLNAFVRKWGGEEFDIEYNFWLGIVGGVVGYIIPLTFTGNVVVSFIIGIGAMLVGGYFGGAILGGEDYE